jgi:hypothetical protein
MVCQDETIKDLDHATTDSAASHILCEWFMSASALRNQCRKKECCLSKRCENGTGFLSQL